MLAPMLECIGRIETCTNGDRDVIFGSTLVQDAVVRNLRTLAEPTQRLSDDVRRRAPTVPWRAMAGFRNVVVHGYAGLDPDVVRTVVERNVPELKQAVASPQASSPG